MKCGHIVAEMVDDAKTQVILCGVDSPCPIHTKGMESSSYQEMRDRMAELPEATQRELGGGGDGNKWDGGKLRVDLLPFDAIQKVALAYTYGSKKYGDNNWRGGMAWTRVFGAIMRHMWAWMLGEDMDQESGCPHLACAGFGILTLLNYADTHPELDDRVKLKLTC